MNSKPREPRHCQKWFMRRRMELVSVLNFDGHRSLFINIYPNLTHVLRGKGSRCTYIYIRLLAFWHFGQGLHIRLWWTTNAAAAW